MPDQAVILLVEDREDDIALIRRAFERAQLPNPVQVVVDGAAAIAYLAGEREYSNRAEYPLPALVLLDLKMPGVDGFEVLRWIRDQPGLRNLVVVVLTSSQDIKDVNIAYKLGANSFMVKPMDFENIVEMSKLIRDYWLLHNVQPSTSRAARNQPRNQD